VGQPLEFDFIDDCPAGSSILAYGVGLGGFTVGYEPGRSWLGSLNVSLMPYLIGTKVYATASAALTDYDKDLGRAVDGGPGNPNCVIQATALALIGTSVDAGAKVVLGNRHGVANGGVVPGIPVGSNRSHWGYVAGFSFTAADTSGSYVGGLSYSVSSSVDGQGSMSLTASATTPSADANGTLDVLAVSLPDAVSDFAVQLLDLPFTPSQDQAMSCTFCVTFAPPAGKSVVHAGLLQAGVNIVYPSDEYFALIQASFSDLVITSPTRLTGTYSLNMYNGATIGAGSSASVYAIAQFG
jgi:hypothetical protein